MRTGSPSVPAAEPMRAARRSSVYSVQALVGRVPREADHPPVAARRQHHADGIGSRRHVQAEAVGPDDIPERRAELHVDPVVQPIVATHRDPE